MHRTHFALPAAALALCACTLPRSHWADVDAQAARMSSGATPVVTAPGTTPTPRVERAHWERGAMALQGFIGPAYLDSVTLQEGGSDVEIDASELDDFPVIGGGAQWKLGGERVDFGLELMFSFGWRTNAIAFASGGGGAVVAVDVDTLIFDVFGGPFVSVFLGPDARVYAAIGPTLQFVDYTQQDVNGGDVDGFGSGWGGYARAGFEFRLPNDMFLGLAVRRTEADVDLDSNLGQFSVDSTQIVLTATTGF